VPLTGATVEGKAEVVRAFRLIEDKAADARTVAEQVAAIGVDAARAAAPVGATGNLVASIAAEVGTNGADLGTDVGYAPFNEFGTVYMPGVRFMGAGYGAMEARAEAIASKWVEGILSDADRIA
jgi:hypothetical protein